MSTFVWKRAHSLAAVALGAVLIAGGVAVAVTLNQRGAAPQTAPTTTSGTTPPTSASPSASSTPTPAPTDPLTGGKASSAGVFAVKIENIAAARPQVGLGKADIVFVEEVEGAQTRLIAVYHGSTPKRLGPVRSARSTDVQLLPMFGRPALVYSGANSRVQQKIDSAPIVAVQRSTRDYRRVAPHNVFVNLDSIAASVKVGKARSIGWTFAEQAPTGAGVSTVDTSVGNDTFSFAFSKGRYTVRWNGRTYADGDTGTLAKADNVVVMRVHNHPDGNRDVLGAPSVQSDTVGSGKVTIYRDGRKVGGTWRRTSAAGPMLFTDPAGMDIALKPGQTWVALKG